jgi:signal transduction histidine kinase
MTPMEIKKALSPFGQVDSSLARKHEGTGLGLPLARSMTEVHGGTFSIESEEGKGTTATVTMPAERVLAAAQSQSAG